MKFSFDPRSPVIRVTAYIHSIDGVSPALLAVDTGATTTSISPDILAGLGLDIHTGEKREIATGNGYVSVRLVSIMAIRCLGQTQSGIEIHCHSLPDRIGIDGLLGLDFLRHFDLHIDFRNGLIELT